MKMTPEAFLRALAAGRTEDELNRVENPLSVEELRKAPIRAGRKGTGFDRPTLRYLVMYNGFNAEDAAAHLNTDYTDGFVVCRCCGTFYPSGKGFKKHLSDGCRNCEGTEKHHTYQNNGSRRHGFSPALMSVYFDDGMHYRVHKAEVGKFEALVRELFPQEQTA